MGNIRHYPGWDLPDRRLNYNIQHSTKDCWCGGHNLNNTKSNINHNSTKLKLNIRRVRRYIINYKLIKL